MLDLPPVTAAWVLLRVPFGSGEISIALRTGPCLMVQPVPETVPLPPGLFRARGAGLSGAFATRALRGKHLDGAVGIAFDPAHLWTPAELDAARAALAAVNEEPA